MRRFVPFLLVLFIVAALLRVNFFFNVFYLFLVLYLLSRLWTRRRMAWVRAERRFVERAFFGDLVTVDLYLRNASWLPVPWLEMHESLPVGLAAASVRRQAISLGPRERWSTSYTLKCWRRGYYPIGPLTVRSGDLLGLERPVSGEVAADYLIVYPQVLPLHELGLPTHSPLAALPARSPLFEDPARVIGVRDYARGDSPRSIHWTATASAGRLLVKQYQPTIARETLICLDLDEQGYEQRQRYTASELAIVAAASVANHVITRDKLPVGLAVEAQDPLLETRTRFSLPPRSERGHLMSVLEVLARVQMTNGTSLTGLLRRESVRLSWGATLLVITGSESADLFDTLLYLRRAGFKVALLLVQPGAPTDELQRQAAQLDVPVHRVWRSQDLEAWG
jgi:uncharacterized protein (DUF58 family)